MLRGDCENHWLSAVAKDRTRFETHFFILFKKFHGTVPFKIRMSQDPSPLYRESEYPDIKSMSIEKCVNLQ